MSDTATIKIQIGNRSYPLKVSAAEEVTMLEAERLINERLKAFETTYTARDQQDLLAMCAIQLATEHLSMKNNVAAQQLHLNTELEAINKLLFTSKSQV